MATINNLQPLADKVFVKLDAPDEQTSSGLYLSQKAQKRSQFGTVMAVGPGKLLNSGVFIVPEVNVGDRVLVGELVQEKMEIDGEEYMVMDDTIILAVVTPDEPEVSTDDVLA